MKISNNVITRIGNDDMRCFGVFFLFFFSLVGRFCYKSNVLILSSLAMMFIHADCFGAMSQKSSIKIMWAKTISPLRRKRKSRKWMLQPKRLFSSSPAKGDPILAAWRRKNILDAFIAHRWKAPPLNLYKPTNLVFSCRCVCQQKQSRERDYIFTSISVFISSHANRCSLARSCLFNITGGQSILNGASEINTGHIFLDLIEK